MKEYCVNRSAIKGATCEKPFGPDMLIKEKKNTEIIIMIVNEDTSPKQKLLFISQMPQNRPLIYYYLKKRENLHSYLGWQLAFD